MFYRIKAIKPIDNYKLLVTFFNDEIKEYNVDISGKGRYGRLWYQLER